MRRTTLALVLVLLSLPSFAADTIVNSYTKSGLPAAGTAGRIARVTDDVHSLWMDTGSLWFGLTGQVVNVQNFGAIGEGLRDAGTTRPSPKPFGAAERRC